MINEFTGYNNLLSAERLSGPERRQYDHIIASHVEQALPCQTCIKYRLTGHVHAMLAVLQKRPKLEQWRAAA